MKRQRGRLVCYILAAYLLSLPVHAALRLKSMAHLSGLQENTLTGYGLVVGLSGSGDSHQNQETSQALTNLMQNFGITVNANTLNARNTASVIVTATLSPFAHQGDKIDVTIASLGDAKSLAGGTLLTTDLKASNHLIYALAQGNLSVNGFQYHAAGISISRNHPTSGTIPGGGIVEKTLKNVLTTQKGHLHFVLNHPDFTTAFRIEKAINQQLGDGSAKAHSAQDIDVKPCPHTHKPLIECISELENIDILPDDLPTVVINERTGVVVASHDVTLDPVYIAQGGLELHISHAKAPQEHTNPISWMNGQTPKTLHLKPSKTHTFALQQPASIGDLMATFIREKITTNDMISILDSLKRAGALHAELIIQ